MNGHNKAFLIDTPTRDRLVAEDPRSAEIVKPYLRGQDVQRWVPAWDGLWMIFTRRGIDIDTDPAVRDYLKQYRTSLEPRPEDWDQERDGRWPGRKPGPYAWYEIQDTVACWDLLEQPKILYPDIVWRAEFSLDAEGRFTNNSVYFLPTADPWLLAVLNSPLSWWFSWRTAQHAKDDALRFFNTFVEGFPIPSPSEEVAADGRESVEKLRALRAATQTDTATLLDWLRVEHEIEKPGRALASPFELSSDEFVEQVGKRQPSKKKPSAAALRSLRDEYTATVEPMRERLVKGVDLERRLSDLVNEAYGLMPEEIDLLWKTAPPRMPVPAPGG